MNSDIKSKISQIENDKVFLNLNIIDRQDIVDLSLKYRFSYQDLRQLSIIARDFYMWDESGVKKCVENFETSQNRPVLRGFKILYTFFNSRFIPHIKISSYN